ncbi:DUF6651 domain-containing protein [Limnoglobus roseus]
MKLKLDDKGAVVVQDGKPVYVTDDGKEIAFDAPATRDTIARLNSEAKTHREAKEAAEGKLKLFEGIEDPAKALKALETVKNYDDKKLIDAGEVEKVKKEAKEAFDQQLAATENKYKPVVDERDALKNELHQEKLGGAFSRSKFIQDKMAIPVDLAQARFGTNFAIEDGKIIAKDGSGNRVYSRARPGEVAEFDEALEILVDSYPYRDSILKGTGASGGGAGGSGGGTGGKKQVTRAQFDAITDPMERAKVAREATITD